MNESLISFLAQRADAGGFYLGTDVLRVLQDLFPRPDWILPAPYKIFFAEEARLPILGFPVADSHALRDLDARLDRWLEEEVLWNLRRDQNKERLVQASNAYFSQASKLAENALLSSLLADYHAVFWLAHSVDLCRHFSSISKRISALDPAAARAQSDTFRYRIFSNWAAEMRDQMMSMKARVAPVLEGDEERGLQFFRVMQENVLIFTEEFVGPDLRELRSFLTGYLHRDFATFQRICDRLRAIISDLLLRDRLFQAGVALFGIAAEQGVPPALLFDSKFTKFLFAHPAVEAAINREERDQFLLVARRVMEYGVLQQLRRGITWMTLSPAGEVVSLDKRAGETFSRSTRPIDFGRAGVVDPMVHRFGLMYDISSFSETLGTLARGGRKGELSSYRQMLLFQRHLEKIAERYRLQFEKFLGDGAFYTTRRALRMVKAAVEIQRFYSEMRRKGFAFDKGLRVALNFGYYRLLPMKGTPESTERVMEFYGPGIVELSRLTTGKATKEIAEIQGFLLSHGYGATEVQEFFAPLAHGVDVVDHKMHQREFFAYVNSTGHLMNEGIVASIALLQELSIEVTADAVPLVQIDAPWGSYIGIPAVMEGVAYIGARLVGHVALKGLSDIEVGEIVPFAEGEAMASEIQQPESMVMLMRQLFHQKKDDATSSTGVTTLEHDVTKALVLCSTRAFDDVIIFIIGQWDPMSDEIRDTVEIPKDDLERLLGGSFELDAEAVESRKSVIEKIYRKAPKRPMLERQYLSSFRNDSNFVGFVISEKVEQL